MPRTVVTPQAVTSAGLGPTFEGANLVNGDGHMYLWGDKRILVVVNGSGASVNVTVQTPGSIDGTLAIPDRVVAVPAGATRYMEFENEAYRQPDGMVYFQFSANTTITLAVIQP